MNHQKRASNSEEELDVLRTESLQSLAEVALLCMSGRLDCGQKSAILAHVCIQVVPWQAAPAPYGCDDGPFWCVLWISPRSEV